MVSGRTNPTTLIRQMMVRAATAELSDRQLVERFIASRDEMAFTALVSRHGPLVMGVCRRVLANSHDVEDAFQATFLVLVRRAASIRRLESVACFLHGVAHRIAVRAKAGIVRRQRLDRSRPSTPPPDSLREVIANDIRALLDDEIGRLPERCRLPFVLCYLEGKTNEEAARLLDCPAGTVMSRLNKARELLRAQLTRRGLAMSAGLVAVMPDAVIAVPPALVQATVQSAIAVATGVPLKTAATAAVASLASAGLPLKTVGWVVLLAMALVAGVGTAVTALAPDDKPAAAKKDDKADAKTDDLAKLKGNWKLTEQIVGGEASPAEKIRDCTAAFDGETLTMAGPGLPKPIRYRVRLDAKAKPSAIDIEALDGPTKGQTMAGIYRLDADKWECCMPALGSMKVEVNDPKNPRAAGGKMQFMPAAARPGKFESPKGTMIILLTLKKSDP